MEGITRVSQYEYVLEDITEERRAALFESVFPETADQAEYDEMNDVWTLDIDSAIRNYFLYQISYSNGGTPSQCLHCQTGALGHYMPLLAYRPAYAYTPASGKGVWLGF